MFKILSEREVRLLQAALQDSAQELPKAAMLASLGDVHALACIASRMMRVSARLMLDQAFRSEGGLDNQGLVDGYLAFVDAVEELEQADGVLEELWEEVASALYDLYPNHSYDEEACSQCCIRVACPIYEEHTKGDS